MDLQRLASIVKTPTYVLAEYLHRRPAPGFDWRFAGRADIVAGAVATLTRDGIVLLPAHFAGERLRQLQAAHAEALRDLPPDAGNAASFNRVGCLDAHPAFLDAALDDTLLEIIARYYGKPFGLSRFSAMRLLPTLGDRTGSFQWHHDGRGRQVHVQILLTAMPAHGQKMTYLKGSHARYYSYYRGRSPRGSRFEADLAANPPAAGAVADVVGPAGTVAVFDANGLHSGNRAETLVRDTLTCVYASSRRHFGKLRCRAQLHAALEPAKQRVIDFNPLRELA